jgi:AraC-like DNA-binding protein/mannose-6-phosphate isomerase-like protein (cupin superfamily)
MHDRLERFTADTLLRPATQVSVRRQQVRRVDVHWHDFYELLHVTSGHACHRVNGVPHVLGPGATVLLSPADFHEIVTESDEPLDYVNVVVGTALVEDRDGTPLPGAGERTAWVLEDGADLARDFARLWDESALDRPGAVAMSEAIVRCLLIELARRCASTPTQPGRPPRDPSDVVRAVVHVDRHFREPLTLAGVAAHAHLSPNYFSERFRAVTGTSFQSYLQQRRLAFAHSLLASTGLGVTEVCHASGFGSLSHFGRAFRSRYGIPPTALRAHLQDRTEPRRTPAEVTV